MNNLLRLAFILFLVLSGTNVLAQTQKKPVKKPVAKPKTEQQKRLEAKAAARVKAKADSVAAVQLLAKKLAREMFVADSIKRAEEETARVAALKRHAELQEEQERARKLAAETASSTKSKATGGRFGIGLKGLGNTNFTQSSDGNAFSPAIGYGVGLTTALRLSERRALVLEILYNRYNYNIEYYGESYTMYENYLQIPLLYRWHTKGENKRFFVNSGLFGEYLFEKWNSQNGRIDETGFALGLVVGGGAEFMVGPGWLSVEARGNFHSNQIVPALSCGYTVFF